MNLICEARNSTLLLVDLQARLLPVIHEGGAVVDRASVLARAAGLLDVPIIGTEQNPDGLGRNVAEIRELCRETLEKTHFDASADERFAALLDPHRDEVIIAGCEAHVCVLQTVLGLIEQGRRVRLVVDAVGSRNPDDKAAAIKRASDAGATLVTTEMVLFEWMRHSNHPEFRNILKLVK